MFSFETNVCREGTGNMKGAVEKRLPEGSVSLWGAEMDYPTAPCVRKALADFAENGIYGFTLASQTYTGTICNWMAYMRGADVDPEWIVPVMGTVFALSTAVRAFTKEGDGVIIQSPSYFRFDSAVARNGRALAANPMIEKNGAYHLDFEDLEAKMADRRNKLMILVNPHNPTGRVFTEAEMGRIGELADRYGVVVFCDEIFAETTQPGHEFRPYACLNGRGITCFSLGKGFNFTGVSQANLLIPDPALREQYVVQRDRDHYGSIDPFFYNAVLAAYSKDGAAWLRAMNAHTAKNHVLITETLRQKMPLLSLSPLEGTFVAWLDCRRLGLNDDALQRFFEQEALLFADPGVEYGASGFYRWNIATPSANIRKALKLLKAAYDRHFISKEDTKWIS